MERIEYRDVIDKEHWGDGPWRHEIDKVQFTDEATGLPCLIKRNHLGILCGYVGVEEGHPAFGKDCEEVPVAVHGGLTFAGFCQEGPEETTICHIPDPEESDHVYWLGFDTGHFRDYVPAFTVFTDSTINDFSTYKTVEYVQAECARLAKQLAALHKI